MKNILLVFAVALMFIACDSNPKEESTRDVVGVPDSTLYKSNTLTDTATVSEPPVTPAPTGTAKTSKRVETVKAPKKTSSSVATKPTETAPENTQPQSTASSSGVATDTVATAPVTPEEKKKGWSNAAKGAAIGGVGGAIGGAIISKKKGKGAIIGGAIGAAGGYILGRKKDKKAAEAADTTAK